MSILVANHVHQYEERITKSLLYKAVFSDGETYLSPAAVGFDVIHEKVCTCGFRQAYKIVREAK